MIKYMEKKIKVVELINSLADGGAETLVKDYATMIDPERFEVIILSLSNDGKSAVSRLLSENKVKVISVYRKWNALTKIKHRLLGRHYVGKALQTVIKEEKPDVIHAHLNTLIYLDDVSDSLNGIKVLYTCHNLPSHIFGDKTDSRYRAASHLIDKHKMRLIALHEDMASEMNQLFGVSNTAVIKNGIDYRRFLNISRSKEEIRKELGIKKEAFVIGHVGRFSPPKNHDAILEIFEEYLKRNDKAVLLLVGQGELKEQFKEKVHDRQLEDRVIILSNRSDIPEINKAMDVFLFPSRWEGFGIALIEAQVAGIPCVASDVVPQTTKISNHVIYESLEARPQSWADDIDRATRLQVDLNSLNHEYDMATEIKKLEALYAR